jgi:release factor glutamine methyltransferase
MRSPEPRTIGEAVETCRLRLRAVSPTPWLDARLLTQHVTGLDASSVIAYGDCGLDRVRRKRLLELVERRASGEPIAYLTGKKSFCGLDIAVDKRVLVPRPESEELVLSCVEELRGTSAVVADVGTGSGALACALAHFLPDAAVVATDVSADALEVSRCNAAALGLAEQIRFVHCDLLTEVDASIRFDAIVANLPYVADGAGSELAGDVRAHEPGVALFGGDDGLDVYRRLFTQAPARMKPNGTLFCEASPQIAGGLRHAAQDAFPKAAIEVRKDGAGLERILICRLAQAAKHAAG